MSKKRTASRGAALSARLAIFLAAQLGGSQLKPESESILPWADTIIQNTRCKGSDRIFSVNGFTKRHISIVEQIATTGIGHMVA
jgi:hypothetical protein